MHTCDKINSKIITTTDKKMDVFWVVEPCSLVEVYHRFRGTCCLHHQNALMMQAARTSETSVNFYQTTRRYNPEDRHLHTRRRENLKSNHMQHWYCDKRSTTSDHMGHTGYLNTFQGIPSDMLHIPHILEELKDQSAVLAVSLSAWHSSETFLL
jgi:hypothetical protein